MQRFSNNYYDIVRVGILETDDDGIITTLSKHNPYCNLTSLSNIQLCFDSYLHYGCFNNFQSPLLDIININDTVVGLEVSNVTYLNGTVISVFCSNKCHFQIFNKELCISGKSCLSFHVTIK